jgi:anaerobic magnesium-protoporphyrin IX monomethyl ester cyclase
MAVAERAPITKKSNIVLVAPQINSTGNVFDRGQVGQFESYFHPNVLKRLLYIPRFTTLGIPPIHGVLEKMEYENVESLDLRYRDYSKPTTEDWRKIFEANVLGLTAITKNAKQAFQIARKYKDANPNGTVIMGGYHVTALPEEALRAGVDIVVRGEGEKTIQEVMQHLENGEPLDKIKGIAYLDKDGTMIITPPRPIMKKGELSDLPLPIYDLMVEKYASYDPLITSTGCPERCDFCGVTIFFNGKYTTLYNEAVMRQLDHLYDLTVDRGKRRSAFIVDDNFTQNQIRTIRLLEEFEESGLFPQGSGIQARIEIANNPKLLKLLREAGVSTIYVGVESISDNTLEKAKKGATREDYEKGLRKMREAGFWVHGMFILGLDGDTKESIEKTGLWAMSNVHSAQFFLPGPLPGTPMTTRMEAEKRIITKDWALYDGHQSLIRPGEGQDFTAWWLQKASLDMTREFYNPMHTATLIWKENLSNSGMSKAEQNAWKKDMMVRSAKLRAYANFALNKMPQEPGVAAYYQLLQAMEKPQVLLKPSGTVWSAGK